MQDKTSELLAQAEEIDFLYQEGAIFRPEAVEEIKQARRLLEEVLKSLDNPIAQNYFKQVN